MKSLFALIYILLVVNIVLGQEILNNEVFDKDIKTVLMYTGEDELSMPIWELGSSKFLTLRFDDLNESSRDYSYRLIHCNANWTPSNLNESEYLEGYFEDQVSEYQSSFNTTIEYTHYTLQIPNDYIRPMISGNYILQVYFSSNPDQIVFNKRFMVIENETGIGGRVSNMNQGAYFYNDQELEIVVEYFGNDFYDLNQNIKLQVLKNYNWCNYLEINQPDIVKDKEFTYNNIRKLKFKGGNEFHHFNIKNIHFTGENIANIHFTDNMYHFLLKNNKDRTFDEYQYVPDIDGLYKVDVTQSDYVHTEADYAYVYFTLNMDAPVQLGDIYVWGGLSNYEFTDDNKLRYNFEQKAYECRMLLKQGYYNYQYVLMEKGKPDFTYIEGNHAVAENSYSVLVYYQDFRGNYDRLIGYAEINSKPE